MNEQVGFKSAKEFIFMLIKKNKQSILDFH